MEAGTCWQHVASGGGGRPGREPLQEHGLLCTGITQIMNGNNSIKISLLRPEGPPPLALLTMTFVLREARIWKWLMNWRIACLWAAQLLAQMVWGHFFQMGKTLTKGGGGFKRILGSAQMDRTLLKKGFPQSLFLHLLPYHIECLFSFMQKLSQEMPQWSMANDLWEMSKSVLSHESKENWTTWKKKTRNCFFPPKSDWKWNVTICNGRPGCDEGNA